MNWTPCRSTSICNIETVPGEKPITRLFRAGPMRCSTPQCGQAADERPRLPLYGFCSRLRLLHERPHPHAAGGWKFQSNTGRTLRVLCWVLPCHLESDQARNHGAGDFADSRKGDGRHSCEADPSKLLCDGSAKAFVETFRQSAKNPKASLGHWVGMSTHDVGQDNSPLRAGMAFAIEPLPRSAKSRSTFVVKISSS